MSNSPVRSLSSWNLTVAICVLSVAFLWPTWASLHDFWLGSTRYSHGHVIVIISAYLFFLQRDPLSRISARPCFPALFPLAVFLAIWLIAVLASVQTIHQIMLPLILWTMLLAVLGWNVAKRLWAQVAYLYLAVPIWEGGNYVLQLATVKAVAVGLWVFQAPAFIEGTVVNLPAGAFEVEGRCSGMHYLVVAIALSTLYCLLYLRSNRSRFLVLAAAIGMALLTNWLRVFTVVYAGYVTDMQHYLVTHDHYYFGWVLFAIILIPYLIFARRVERSEDSVPRVEPPLAESGNLELSRRPLVALCVCVFGLMISSGTVYASNSTKYQNGAQVSLPSAKGTWVISDSVESQWRPHYVGAAAETFKSYIGNQGTVVAYRNLYRGQVQGKELVGFNNQVEGSDHWSIVDQRVGQIELGSSENIWVVREIFLAAASGEKRMLYLWYDVGGQHTVSDLEAKFIYGINVLRGKPDAGVSILSVACGQDCNGASATLREWLSDHVLVNGDI